MGRATVRTVLQRPVCDGAQGRHGDRAARHTVGPPRDRARQAAAKRRGCAADRRGHGAAASVAGAARLRLARAAGPGDEYFGAGGCAEIHHAV